MIDMLGSKHLPPPALRVGRPLLVLLVILLGGLGDAVGPGRPDVAAESGVVEARIGGATTAVVPWRDRVFALVGSQLRVYGLGEHGRIEATGLRIDLPEVAEDMALMGDRLYLPLRGSGSHGQAELRVYQLWQEGLPELVGRPLRLPARELGAIALDYPTAYLLTEDRLLLIDIKDPERPALRQALHLGRPATFEERRAWRGSVVAAEGRVWVARPWGLFRVDDADGRPVARPMDLGDHRALALGPRHLAAVQADGRLVLWERDRLGAPTATVRQAIEDPSALAWLGDRLLVVGQAGRALRRIDVSDPARPELLDPLLPLAIARSEDAVLSPAGAGLLLALERGGLIPLDAEGRPRAGLDRRELPPVEQLHLQAGKALAAAGDAGLYQLDMAAPGGPALESGIGLVASGDRLREIDLLQPSEASAQLRSGREEAVVFRAVTGDVQHAYALTEARGLLILDLGPGRIGPVMGHLPDLPRAMRATAPLLRAGRLYLAGGDGSLRIVDVRDPRNPRLAGQLSGLGAQNLAWFEDRLLVSGHGTQSQGRLTVVDPVDPSRPRVTARLELAQVHERMSLIGGLAYLTGASGRVEVVDLREPDLPVLRGALGFSGLAAGQLAVDGDTILAGQLARLDRFQRFGNGSLMHLAREPLPATGLDWLGRTDVHIERGRVVMLRGRAGIFLRQLSDAPMERALPRRPLYLPSLVKQTEEKTAAPVCHRPAMVALSVDASFGTAPPAERDALLRWVQDYRARSAVEGRQLLLGRFGAQAEMLPDAEALTETRGASAPTDHRLDLAMVLARRQAEMLGIAEPRAALILLAGPAVDPHSRQLADRRARGLRDAGWRVARIDPARSKGGSSPAEVSGLDRLALDLDAQRPARALDLGSRLDAAAAVVETCP